MKVRKTIFLTLLLLLLTYLIGTVIREATNRFELVKKCDVVCKGFYKFDWSNKICYCGYVFANNTLVWYPKVIE